MVGGPVRRLARAALGAALMAGLPASGAAQSVVRVDVGATSRDDAVAVRTQWYGERVRGWFVTATARGSTSFGGWVEARVAGIVAGAGDAVVALALPTDRAGGSPGVLGRGLAVGDSTATFTWRAFAGWTALARSSVTGLQTADTGEGVAVADLSWRPRTDLGLSARHSIAEGGASHLVGVTWSPPGAVRFDAVGGSMSGGFYGALAADLAVEGLDIEASWTHANAGQRRIATDGFFFQENVGLSGRATWRPREGWHAELGRARRNPSFLDDVQVEPRTVHHAALGIPLGRAIHLGAGVHHSPDPAGGPASEGVRTSLGASVGSWLRADVQYFESRGGRNGARRSAVVTARERVRPSLELLQRFAFDGWDWPSVSVGGRYRRGASSVGVDYRTEFVPGVDGDQFRTALVLELRWQISATRDLTASTYIDALGRARYQVRTGQWFYPGSTAEPPRSRGLATPEYRFPDYLVRGRVVLADGSPVEGAAVRVGETVLYTDGEGRFLVRTPDDEPCVLTVMLDDFLLPGLFGVVDAPDSVEPEREDEAGEVTIVLERLRRPRPGASESGPGSNGP